MSAFGVCDFTARRYSDVIKTVFKTKTKPSVQDQHQDFASQDQDQYLFVMYTRGRLRSTFSFSAVNENAD